MFKRKPANALYSMANADRLASQHGDPFFILSLVVLCACGVLMVYSSSFYKAAEAYRDSFFFIKNHLLRLGIGFALFMIAYRTDYHRLRRWSVFPYILCLILLVLVLFEGSGVNRWIRLFGITVQPSEFARIALVIYLADWCSRNSNRLQRFVSGFGFAILIIALPVGLTVIEPSFTAASMIAISGLVVLFLSGARVSHMFAISILAIPTGIWVAIKQPYRLERIVTFIQSLFGPIADIQDSGYQAWQSLIAIGSGGLLGVGLGESGQKLGFLPEAHCDFIYSILCEETGLWGALLVLTLFLLFAIRGVAIAKRAGDQFGFLLASGLVASIILFTLVNVAVTLALIPVTGLPLPFISYGGSSLIADLIACGLILNVSRHADSPEAF